MVVPKHWTLLLVLCALKLSSILLFLVISAEIWLCGCHLSKASNPMDAQSPVVCACIVRALECRKTFDGPVTGAGHVLKTSLSEFSGQQTFGLVVVVLDWVSHNTVKINSAIGSYKQKLNKEQT